MRFGQIGTKNRLILNKTKQKDACVVLPASSARARPSSGRGVRQPRPHSPRPPGCLATHVWRQPGHPIDHRIDDQRQHQHAEERRQVRLFRPRSAHDGAAQPGDDGKPSEAGCHGPAHPFGPLRREIQGEAEPQEAVSGRDDMQIANTHRDRALVPREQMQPGMREYGRRTAHNLGGDGGDAGAR
jgi:hypothetical protein